LAEARAVDWSWFRFRLTGLTNLPKQTTLDPVYAFIAHYLWWARQIRVYATYMPMISYRGHACESWQLLPSLCRQKLPARLLKQMELEVFQQFRSRFGLADWKDMEILSYAHHHGAPTRLLDWSRNPFVGLWFAVADKQFDATPGTVFQLNLLKQGKIIRASSGDIRLNHLGNDGYELAKSDPAKSTPTADEATDALVHVFPNSPRLSPSERQRSVFSIATFAGDIALRPLEAVCVAGGGDNLRQFTVPPVLKADLRHLLADLGLDAYSIYGDADSFGKSLAICFDLSPVQREAKPPSDDGWAV
jgi:hypothetical protein